MTGMNEFSDLYEFVYKLMNSYKNHFYGTKKKDRWGFQPGTNIALEITDSNAELNDETESVM